METGETGKQLLKEKWLERESSYRQARGLAVVVPLDSWQVWRTDPRGLPTLHVHEHRRYPEYLATKLDPNAVADRRLHFRPAVVLSSRKAHEQDRAFVSFLSTQAINSPAAIAMEGTRKPCAALLFWLRSVSVETLQADRELVCFDAVIAGTDRASLAQGLRQYLSGAWADDEGAVPGTMVRAVHHADFEGVVLTSCTVSYGATKDRILLVAQSVGDHPVADYDVAMGSKYGLLILPAGATNPERPGPYAVDALSLRAVREDSVDVVGHIPDVVMPLSELIMQYMAQDQ